MQDNLNEPTKQVLALPGYLQLLVGILLLMLTLLWHNKYRAYKPSADKALVTQQS
jgi:hypothetical protein